MPHGSTNRALSRDTLPEDDLAGFRDDVRAFLAQALTPDLREAARRTVGVHSAIDACRKWHGRLFHKGWIAPAWPVAFGGTGWSAQQRFLFEQECARHDAPILFAAGLRSIGPLIIARGTPEQRRRYLPKILTGEDLWCQGFSEADAGSDLAALNTRAARVGDTYRINGRKLWTTGAHLANRMFALVRTRSAPKPQEGITFLTIDMAAPGMHVRPIVTLDGEHEFNEVVFDDTSVPVTNRIGEENEGWAVAKQLMRFARGNNTNSSLLRRAWRGLQRAVDASSDLEPMLTMRLAEAETALMNFESFELSLLQSGKLSGDDETSASLMKVVATELHQRISELLLDVAGHCAMAHGSFPARKYLATRAASIYSGTSEIHRNLIARDLLGPRGVPR